MFRGTTILAIKKDDSVVIVGDGQVSLGNTVMKSQARKVRRMDGGKVIAGFAGSTADAFTLFEKFEAKLKEYSSNLKRAAVELAKEWRTDRVLRKLEALLIVANKENLFVISGTGDVIEPDDGVCAIGSGGMYALSAARVLVKHADMPLKDKAVAAMEQAADICIYTNANFTIEEL